MAEEQPLVPAIAPVEQPLNLIPVVLKEAALDSPTFRATAVHFGEQVEIIEKWLDSYVKSASRLSSEASSLENLVNTFLSNATPPQQVSEAVLDHDYTVLALKRYGEGAREFWSYTLRGMKRIETAVVEPIRAFLSSEIKGLKECRKTLDAAQKNFDLVIARYASQAKTKEPSSLREDAFQLHEARKAYLKASMDFCVVAPQVRGNLDKLLVRLFSDQWREMKSSRDSTVGAFSKWTSDMERVRGWSREMENGERLFKRELFLARRQIESSAEGAVKPSRELDDYAISTVPYLGSQAASTANLQTPGGPPKATNDSGEKQSWLFQRTTTGKPARTMWVRRWYFVKNGIFGWLSQGGKSGAVEESEKIGVLLCSIRPAVQEERRFCFEVKTKDTSILLQAETQIELMEWINAFDVAKRKALEDPASTDNISSHNVDAAFAISPPVAPEFAAKVTEGHASSLSDDIQGLDRSGTLTVDSGNPLVNHAASFDISRRLTERDGESSSRDHATRIIQRLDLHRRTTASPQLSSTPTAPAGGIASLISASHNILPVGPATPQVPATPDTRINMGSEISISTLAPSTLANPPAPTNLSKTAVIVSGERGVGLGKSEGGMPSGIMANLWGSTNWGYVNRLERGELKAQHSPSASTKPSPMTVAAEDNSLPEIPAAALVPGITPDTQSGPAHRKAASVGDSVGRVPPPALVSNDDFPNYYPLPLKAQDAQFRILFPNTPKDERVVLVFRAVWNPTDQQEFPGRVYVTTKEIYFYSNHLGLILITGVNLTTIDEVTGAPGKDCDFLYLHFKDAARQNGAVRLTIKTFLEPLRLLQKRLDFLVQNANSVQPESIEDVLRKLIRFEMHDSNGDEPDHDSWEDVSINTPVDGPTNRRLQDLKTRLRIDGNLFENGQGSGVGRSASKFKLPSQPVIYTPIGMTEQAVEKVYDISAKSLFHVLFGDKSAVFQMVYKDRFAKTVVQGPWVQTEQQPQRRDFAYDVEDTNPPTHITDCQVIEVFNDHLCYVVVDKKSPWYLPLSGRFTMVSKIVLTHVAKSQCKLAIFIKTEWNPKGSIFRPLIDRQALKDMELSALDLIDVITDQVNKLGSTARTRKAIQIFGSIGQQNTATQFVPSEIPSAIKDRKFVLKVRTLPGMTISCARHYFIAGILVVANGLMSVASSILEACTAHSMLTGLLLLSIAFNMFFTQRDTFTWWRERAAGKFMARIGVGPNMYMSRAVYMHDLNKFTNITAFQEADGHNSSSKCRTAFHDLLVDPEPSSLSPFDASSTQSITKHRLQRSRLRLGTYRHDLLVALRLVNRVESEVLQAEYEDWLVDETGRCQRVGGMLASVLNGTDGDGGDGSSSSSEADAIQPWYEEYCGSCNREMERIGLSVHGGVVSYV
ncbi:hypothetical protein EJ05DRAFT_370852 [Pseudovirgaria hyperparasitica]|uniref:Transcription factor SipA3 n=1 Tax=Pseudovirgaria hyperparasitica TaxID=470096 RepID=A0A6A6W6R0_9PEZI|nr:uncharacterized protein EJ05DRAFT_370852 [Pseudovirgaria hyperparasitica]KAF2757889.1 hypothetical protein EJ05DRAFT_370852 [Pseudovirgaria hyperparasitica]